MASPFSLKNSTPRTAWLLTVLSSFALILLGVFVITWLSSSQNQKLVEYEFRIILKGNGDLLRVGNLRGFSEGLLHESGNFFLRAESIIKPVVFEVGASSLIRTGQCAREHYLEYNLVYCRENPIPFVILSVFLGLFVFLILMTGFLLKKLSLEMVASFKKIFDLALIKYDQDLDFSEAWRVAGNMANQFNAYQSEMKQLEHDKAITDLAKQVAHDIRSPVAALRMAIRSLNGLTDVQFNLIQSSTNRIQNIADDLLDKSRKVRQHLNPLPTCGLNVAHISIADVVAEKLAISPKLRTSTSFAQLESNRSILIQMDLNIFKRIVSIVIDNALDSFEEKSGVLKISSEIRNDYVVFIFEDNGKGISADILPKLWAKGATFGKSHGSGLGLNYLKNNIELWEGACEITSKIGIGTILIIKLKFTDSNGT